jgi:hypothetical protein
VRRGETRVEDCWSLPGKCSVVAWAKTRWDVLACFLPQLWIHHPAHSLVSRSHPKQPPPFASLPDHTRSTSRLLRNRLSDTTTKHFPFAFAARIHGRISQLPRHKTVGKLGKRRYSGEDLGSPRKKAMSVSVSVGAANPPYPRQTPTVHRGCVFVNTLGEVL